MQELFVKKYWDEEDILFYIHFQGEDAVRQLQISSKEKVFLTSENPLQGEYGLYDQSLSDLDLEDSDFITKEEFDKAWEES